MFNKKSRVAVQFRTRCPGPSPTPPMRLVPVAGESLEKDALWIPSVASTVACPETD